MSKECPSDPMIVARRLKPDLSHDMVLGPRLDDVKEEVKEEKPSSLWMLGNSSLTAVNVSCDEKSELLIGEMLQGNRAAL